MSDTTLLPPTSATTGFYSHSNDKKHDRNRDDAGGIRDLLLAGRIDDDTRMNLNAIHESTASAKDSTERFGITNLTSTEKGSAATQVGIERVGAALGVNVEKGVAALGVAIEKIGAANEVAFKENLFELAKLNGQNELENAKNYGNIQLLQEKNYGHIQILSEKQTRIIEVEGLRNTKAIELQADRNTAAIQAAIAACCCENRELTRAEGAATRDLIRELDNNRTREALSDAKSEILALRLGAKAL